MIFLVIRFVSIFENYLSDLCFVLPLGFKKL